ncbi:MAG TPA: hypothetical protein VF469_05980 [Kofleriaceae bacterium]
MTMFEPEDTRSPGRTAASDVAMPGPGKQTLVERADAAAPQPRPVTADSFKATMTTSLREDLPRALPKIDPALGSEKQLLTEGVNAASLVYVQECERLKLKAPGLAATLPRPADLTQKAIEDTYKAIQNCPELTDSLAEEHWAEHQAQVTANGGTHEAYLAERHQAERQKAAAAWSQAAAKVVELADRQRATGPGATLQDQIKQRTAKKEGRDHAGRLGYFAMTTDTDDVMGQMGVNAADPMTGRAQGGGALTAHLADIFSSAACHKDARQTCDLLSQKIHGAATQRTVHAAEEVPGVLGEIMGAVDSCPGPVKLVKLSVYDNHSMLFVIGEGRATRLETVAAPDSKSILVNDLIRNPVTTQQASAAIKDGLTSLCKSEHAVELEYEVHQAASHDTVEGRVHDKLRRNMTQVGVGMAVGSWEMADLHERQQDLLEARGEDLDGSYGVKDITGRSRVNLPESSARDGKLNFHALSEDTVVTEPRAGTEYRVESEGSWLHVKVENIVAEGQPAWMYPMLELAILKVNPNLRTPIAPASAEVSKPLAMWSPMFKGFNLAELKSADLTGRVFQKHNGEAWIVTQDPGPSGGMTRPITMKPQ